MGHLSGSARVRLLLLIALVLGAAASAPRPGRRASSTAEFRLATATYDVLGERQRIDAASLTNEDVLHLAYLQRLHLGLGGAFRLIDYALQDPRLSVAGRHTVGSRLLSAVLEGDAYHIEPAALLRIVPASTRTPAAAAMHADLIDATVRNAADPRAGELAVRIAYAIAAAEKTVDAAAPALAANAAALFRDRELARRDARRLLAAATEQGVPALTLVSSWRAEQRFESEQPTGMPHAGNTEIEAAERAPALVTGLRAAAHTFAVLGDDAIPSSASVLDTLSARRLARAEGARPPSAPVAVTLDRNRAVLVRVRGGAALARAGNEEQFAAEYTRARGTGGATVAAIGLEVAVALRAYAQERVWHPGFPAPTDEDLLRRFGLRAVEFDRGVAARWRPYYRNLIADALTDLRRVVPDLDVSGLRIRFGATGRDALAPLAVHVPSARRIYLPPRTGPGVIAHEIAHDLDWQVARRRFHVTGTYGTDIAVLHYPTDHFAASVLGMPRPPVAPLRGEPTLLARYASRPTETFARAFETYVALSLALLGRSNGDLSSYQDARLAGHGAAVVPEARTGAVEALLPVLSESSPAARPAATEFARVWAADRSAGPLELVSEMLYAAPHGKPVRSDAASIPAAPNSVLPAAARARSRVVEQKRAEILSGRASAVCSNPFRGLGARGEAALVRLIDVAASARQFALNGEIRNDPAPFPDPARGICAKSLSEGGLARFSL
jgi:hypothetical protein